MSDLAVLGVRLTAQRYQQAVETLLGAARERRRLRAHFCTVHSVVASTSDPALRDSFASAGMLCMDGLPLVWVSRLRGAAGAQRVCGPDVMLTLCDLGRAAGLRHYFLGGATGVAEELAAALQRQFHGLEVVGTMSPPFRAMTALEQQAVIDGINATAPDVLWIGLGSPKQDIWAAANEQDLKVPLILPVGAAFDFHSGRLRRAPSFMQRIGLEWLFRLLMEPRRLLGRYLITNTRFIVLLAEEALTGRKRAA